MRRRNKVFSYSSVQKQLWQKKKALEKLQFEQVKDRSDLDYVAMMCGIDLDLEDEDENAEV